MSYDDFINNLIEATKNNKVEWERSKIDGIFTGYPEFLTANNQNILVIRKFEYKEEGAYGDIYITLAAELLIYSQRKELLSEIKEEDLDMSSNLLRLYRIVERKVNKVEEILENFITGIDDNTNLHEQ